MLKTYLKSLPYTKFILIEDTIEERGKDLYHYLLRLHLRKSQCNKLNYFVFEGVFSKIKGFFQDFEGSLVFHDFVSVSKRRDYFREALQSIGANELVIIDSLSQLLLQYELPFVYKTFHELCKKRNVLQLIAILHLDTLEDPVRVPRYFEHLSTCCIKIEPKLHTKNRRVVYVYRKAGGKIVKQIEEFRFENNELITEPLKKLDASVLVQENLNQMLPENLTTFKISLEDREKESRDKLVLPYLPKSDSETSSGPKIFYEFDSVDDWDEEDPDDDLDI